MGAGRTLLNHQRRALGQGRFGRRRARKGTPFWRIIQESTLGNLYHAYHATKGWRQRAVSWQTIRDAQREGPLDKFWQTLRAFWRSQQIGRPRYGVR